MQAHICIFFSLVYSVEEQASGLADISHFYLLSYRGLPKIIEWTGFVAPRIRLSVLLDLQPFGDLFVVTQL